MLDSKGFNMWADGYDMSVNLCEEDNEYPFAGYKSVLNRIYSEIHKKINGKILDIGFGTGVLTQKLYHDGYEIFGVDFSDRMIEIAKEKMPNATLIQYDFSNGLPEILLDNKYDYIISTYAIHHLTTDNKIHFINQLLKCLKENGVVLIGDVAFETQKQQNICREKSGDGWDNDEIYIVFDDLKQYFPTDKIMFQQISDCAGVITFTL